MSIEDSYKKSKIREQRTFMLSVTVVLILTFCFAWLSGFYNVALMALADKKELARLIATVVFPLSGILTFVFTQSINLREKLRKSQFTKPIQLTACTRLSQISTATVILCALAGLLSIYYFKSVSEKATVSDMPLVGGLCLLSSIFVLLIFNVVYFYHTNRS